MFRIQPGITQTRVILQRKVPLQVQISCISRLPPLGQKEKNKEYHFRERDVCPQPPPCPPPPPTKRPWLWQLLGVLAATGAFTVYAHDHPKVRDWLSMNAPWFDDWIAIVYQENQPILDSMKELMCSNPLTEYMRKNEKQPDCVKPKLVSESCVTTKPATHDTDGKKTPEQVVNEKAKEIKEKVEEVKDTREFKERGKDELCEDYGGKMQGKEKEEHREGDANKKVVKEEKKHKEPTKEELAEMSRCVGELTQCVRCNLDFAKDACAQFSKVLGFSHANLNFRQAERAFSDYNTTEFNKLDCKNEKRKKLVAQHLKKTDDPRKRLKDTETFVCCGVKDPKMKKELEAVLTESRRLIKEAYESFDKERRRAKQLFKKYLIVKPFMDKIINENQMFVRGLNYEDHPQYYFDGDLDLLLQHTIRNKYQLKKQLEEDRKHLAKRAGKALNSLACDEKGRNANLYKVEAAAAKKRGDIVTDINYRYVVQYKENDEALQKALQKQKDKFEAKTAKLLAAKEIEAAEKLKNMVAEKVESERENMRNQLNDMKKQLKKVEDKLNAKLKAEEDSVKAQSLYAAGSRLLAATQQGNGKRVCVIKELKAIEKSAKGDELVTTVLKSIPEEVHEHGVVPESTLKHKFKKVEQVARKVALVELEGSPLPVYWLSWMQSMLLLKRMDVIPQEELKKPVNQEISVRGLDTFDILARARYWMDRGDLARALAYVERLEGASRGAADRWLQQARAHLETKQAARAIIAHAANINLKNI